MTDKTVTRANLAEVVYHELGLSRNDCSGFVDDLFEMISEDLSKGNSVKISGFGTFSLIQKAKRIGRNPKTGEQAIITPRKVISFKASSYLKDSVNRKS